MAGENIHNCTDWCLFSWPQSSKGPFILPAIKPCFSGPFTGPDHYFILPPLYSNLHHLLQHPHFLLVTFLPAFLVIEKTEAGWGSLPHSPTTIPTHLLVCPSCSAFCLPCVLHSFFTQGYFFSKSLSLSYISSFSLYYIILIRTQVCGSFFFFLGIKKQNKAIPLDPIFSPTSTPLFCSVSFK